MPRRAIARFENCEQEALPVRTRCAQPKPLYGEMNRWYPSMAAIAKFFMCLVGRQCWMSGFGRILPSGGPVPFGVTNQCGRSRPHDERR